jgi:hypothetical protein
VEVKRATFEQVQKAQEELIFSDTGLDKLAELKETISPDTRNIFFQRLAFALLGKELDYPFILEYDGQQYNLGSLSVISRQMAYYTDTDDKKQELVLKGKKIKIPINVLWNTLRDSLYKPMAEALTLAMKSSQEIFRGGSDSYGFNPDEKI